MSESLRTTQPSFIPYHNPKMYVAEYETRKALQILNEQRLQTKPVTYVVIQKRFGWTNIILKPFESTVWFSDELMGHFVLEVSG